MLSIYYNDDAGYEARLESGPVYVYNDFGGSDPGYMKLHRADCRTLQIRRGLKKTSVRKVCGDTLDELIRWLRDNRGPEGKGYTVCSVCLAEVEASVHDVGIAEPATRSSLSVGDLASKLVEVYQGRKIPAYVYHSERAGFTRTILQEDPESLFRMIVIAAYDRQPFTRVARGWEPIWGIQAGGESLPQLLIKAGVFDLAVVLGLKEQDIQRRLAEVRFYHYRMDTDGAHTRYARTFKEAAVSVNGGLHRALVESVDEWGALTVFRGFDDIHGIGPTIASKLVMYTLREIGVGKVPPSAFVRVVEPILGEYHNARMAQKLERKFGPNCLELLFEELKALGDPFAIDALYYVDRDEPQLEAYLLGES